MFSMQEMIAWVAIATMSGFAYGYTVGLASGKREGFIRGKIAGRKAVANANR